MTMIKKTKARDIRKPILILGAWHNYCMTSTIFRILRFFGFRK